MSSLGRWTYKELVTIWPIGSTDEWGQPSWGSPYTLLCRWTISSETMTNADGREFVSRSIYRFELEDGDPKAPERGFFIMRGDHTATVEPPTGSEKIEDVGFSGRKMFGANEIPDWKVVT